MTLSAKVPAHDPGQPAAVARAVARRERAVHRRRSARGPSTPAGRRSCPSVEEALGLPTGVTDVSRRVLAGHGNMSSPTVLFILNELRKARPRGRAWRWASGRGWWPRGRCSGEVWPSFRVGRGFARPTNLRLRQAVGLAEPRPTLRDLLVGAHQVAAQGDVHPGAALPPGGVAELADRLRAEHHLDGQLVSPARFGLVQVQLQPQRLGLLQPEPPAGLARGRSSRSARASSGPRPVRSRRSARRRRGRTPGA